MISLLLAIIIVTSSAAVCFGLLFFAFGLPREIAGSIGGSVFSAITFVHKLLERKKQKTTFFLVPKTIVPMNEYTLHWYLMIVYSSMILLSIFFFSNLYAGAVIGISNVQISGGLVGLMVLPVLAIGSYFIGRWVGIRCDKYGIMVVILSLLFARISFSIMDIWLATEEEVKILFGEAMSVQFMFKQMVLAFLCLGGPALIGYWRGRKIRLAKYIGYLLGLLPPDTRSTIVNLTYEEATRINAEKPTGT